MVSPVGFIDFTVKLAGKRAFAETGRGRDRPSGEKQ
jgi:hypothetical protein